MSKLEETNDARLMGPNPQVFEGYARYAGTREFPEPDWAQKMDKEDIILLKEKIAIDETPIVWKEKWIDNEFTVGKWKLIPKSAGLYDLYDLEKDPDQLKNLAKTHGQVLENLVGFYKYWKEKKQEQE